MNKQSINRREFVSVGALATGAMALAKLGAAPLSGAVDTTRTVGYNPGMEYRRLGKTGLMASASWVGRALEADLDGSEIHRPGD